MPNSPTVLVASDDAFELATLSAALRLHSVNVVAEASTTEIAENLYKFLSPQVALIDLQFAGAEALALINKFRKVNPSLGVVLITACPDLRLLGLVEKQIPQGAQIVLKKSIADLTVVSHSIVRSIAAVDAKEKMAWVDSHGSLHENSFSSILNEFTDIQIETFRLLAKGLSNSEIAKVRVVSEKSVEQIVARIAQHLQVLPDRAQNLRVVLTGEYFKWIGAPRH
ncbi:two-component system response regulator [Candidatus Planktophila lacus]|uniref:LuxR C-terminal-related transcriptional regulator n=1 Tax=Candidatus Planktophila lacus TaxID=1884913 RepID=UPI000BACC6E1|nr:LuxR C-terminal-related transcriptional regulator [Candidatus Planktophila lacus]ASY24793.1 two-component system response regulator [Candidatus Planktophila lacus]ASY28750.1 two-component system response regulator [Candidatus Planktophila lacus]MCX6442274.1 response regulator [Actinomycetota bacterium]